MTSPNINPEIPKTTNRTRTIVLILFGIGLLFVGFMMFRSNQVGGLGGSGGELRLVRHSVIDNDPNGIGGEALSLVVPQGWQVEGGVSWNHNLFDLALYNMRIYNPNGSEVVDFFPVHPYTYSESGLFGFPVGSIYLGHEVLPTITNTRQYIEQVIIPRFRANTNAQVTDVVDLPGFAQEVAKLNGAQNAVASRVRVEYSINGVPTTEDFYVSLFYQPNPYIPGMTRWGNNLLYSVRANSDQIENFEPIGQAIASSLNINLDWYNKYYQVIQLEIERGFQSIAQAGALSRYISQISNEILDITVKSYNSQQQAYDRIYNNISEGIRGVETYSDPFKGGTVELPSDYTYAWASENGEYVFSNSAIFNPNIGSTANWELLKTAP